MTKYEKLSSPKHYLEYQLWLSIRPRCADDFRRPFIYALWDLIRVQLEDSLSDKLGDI